MARRKTAAQQAVLEILQQNNEALSHEGISERLAAPLDRVTLYRILNRFLDDGLVHRIVADDGRQYFAGCESGCSHDRQAHGHLHFRCVICDKVECLDEPVVYHLPNNYRADNYNMMVSGTCGTCQSE
ncbi:Fur family transcriptional regulator [Lewinella sp. 4G2]|uniref:Fur family transcriptional regulator n=1 Tax=Lewinella sp. 4G2 TaxID=1803372 RepID=UPI0007B4B802|nr:transcriptional repressor [Lewinella sp. 4G2]OAV45369.1 transcriptional regulator [Lewinella sp. 4G2]